MRGFWGSFQTIGYLAGFALCGCSPPQAFTTRMGYAPLPPEIWSASYDVKSQVVTEVKIPPKVDLLWVVDNSGSMANVQAQLRAGVAGFAQEHLKAETNFRVAAITTDTYLAGNPSAQTQNFFRVPITYPDSYADLNEPDPNLPPDFVQNGQRPLLSRASAPFQFKMIIPCNSTTTGLDADPATCVSTDINAPKLLTIGFDSQGQIIWQAEEVDFQAGALKSYHRVQYSNTTPKQKINDLALDLPIQRASRTVLSTVVPTGQDPNAYLQSIQNDFVLLVSPGIMGSGLEKPMESFTSWIERIANRSECLAGGSAPSSCFFRPNSIRAVFIVTDETDSSYGSTDFSSSGCDPATSVYNLSAPAQFLSKTDDAFKKLDGITGTPPADYSPNYFVRTVVNTQCSRSGGVTNYGPELMELVKQLGIQPRSKFASQAFDIKQVDFKNILSAFAADVSQSTTVITATIFETGQNLEPPKTVAAALVYHDPSGREATIALQPNQYQIDRTRLLLTDQAVLKNLPVDVKLLITVSTPVERKKP